VGYPVFQEVESASEVVRETAQVWGMILPAELTEQGQITDRYTKAVEQLGSDKLDVRIGGIYALERIARIPLKTIPP